MTPRPYTLGQRQTAADQTRARILRAARELLTAKGGSGRFSLGAVARRAGVARMTVYYQFGSRRGLLEALLDSFALKAELPKHLGAAFQNADPERVLGDIIMTFARFWDAGRPWIRRVSALGVLDRDLGEELEARNERRRGVVRALLARFDQPPGRAASDDPIELEQILFAITSFPVYDSLAGPDRSFEDVAPMVLKLARASLGLRPE